MRTWLCCLLLGGCHWAFGIAEVPPLPPDAPPPPPGRWTAVSAGAAHVCAIDMDQHAYCWGEDQQGQLGTGTPTLVPKALGTTTWLAIAAGPFHSCGIQSDGKPWCWGLDDFGQTSGAQGPDVEFPKQVAVPISAAAFDAVGVGLRHSCAIGNGQIYCWGDPSAIGAGGLTSMPTPVLPAVTWSRLAVGFDHTCALDATGSVWCWGHDDFGQLGGPPAQVPAMVGGFPGGAVALAISAGKQFTCAVISTTPGATAGQIWCWGSNDGKVLGTGGGQPPMQVVAGDDWDGIAAGNVFACGLRGGMATCWGTAFAGGFGDGLWSEVIVPAVASHTFPADAVSIGIGYDGEENHCALAAHDLTCWGDNRGGQLGVPPTIARKAVAVPSPTSMPWASVAVGLRHTCARDAASETFCWGADDVGQISGAAGLGTTAPCTPLACDHPNPTAAPQPVTTGELVAGSDFTCAHNSSALDCWGTNVNGELGTADPLVHASHRSVASDAKLIGGGRAVCDFGPTTPLECWGLIASVPTRAPTPIAAPQLTGIYAVAFGDNSQCAIVGLNRRACWGYNYQAELGDGTSAMPADPPKSPALQTDSNTYQAISLNSQHACAATATGGLECWGSDYQFESGDSLPTSMQLTLLPHPVANLAGCTRTSTSYDVSCAICAGKVACWGLLAQGRLGRDVDSTSRDFMPGGVVMPSATSTWIDLGTGASHSCAVSADGALACWGFGLHGQLGDGGHASNLPVPIPTP